MTRVLTLVGVRLVADSLDIVNTVECIPLEKLDRTRIHIFTLYSGVFHDLFIYQMNLMDRGIKMVVEADKLSYMNFIRKHALT